MIKPQSFLTLLLLLILIIMSSIIESTTRQSVYSKIKDLKLIAFDLDGTIWTPGI